VDTGGSADGDYASYAAHARYARDEANASDATDATHASNAAHGPSWRLVGVVVLRMVRG